MRWCILSVCLWACAPSQTTIAAADDEPADQWSRGVWLYGQHCAGCHGEEGEGGDDTPSLAGKGSLTRFATASELFAYVRTEMPQLEPGALEEDQYWAVLAYALKQAGVPLGQPPLGAHNAAHVRLH